MVPTLGHHLTNMQSAELHNHAGQQYSSRHLFGNSTPYHYMLSLHFLVEAFINSGHVRSHCICSMYHTLTCSCVAAVFISISRHPLLTLEVPVHAGNGHCTWVVSSSQTTESLCNGKQTSLTATFFTVQCRNTNEEALHQTWVHKQEHISLLMFNCIWH
jgi:hypothetical protein